MTLSSNGVEQPGAIYYGLRKTVTFDGSNGGGAVGTVSLFTVTGNVGIVSMIPAITADITSAGAATAALGVTGSTAYLIAATAKANMTAANGFWQSTSPATPLLYGVFEAGIPGSCAISTNVILTVATADITSGAITFKVIWEPLTSGSSLVSAPANVGIRLTGTAIAGGVLESEIVTGGQTIILTLANDTWVSGASFTAAQQGILDGFVSGGAEAHGWNNERANITASTAVVRTSDTVVTITLPALGAYVITADETITATIPGAALTAGNAIVAAPTMPITNT